jgi:hypothetical protein
MKEYCLRYLVPFEISSQFRLPSWAAEPGAMRSAFQGPVVLFPTDGTVLSSMTPIGTGLKSLKAAGIFRAFGWHRSIRKQNPEVKSMSSQLFLNAKCEGSETRANCPYIRALAAWLWLLVCVKKVCYCLPIREFFDGRNRGNQEVVRAEAAAKQRG